MKSTDNKQCLARLAESSMKPPPEPVFRIRLELLRYEIEMSAPRPVIQIMLRHIVQAEHGGYLRTAVYFAKEGLKQQWFALRYRLGKLAPKSKRERAAMRELGKLIGKTRG